MIFYKRLIGDIQTKTGHLSPSEMGAYDRLLDHYYSTEAPLPELVRCYSIVRAIKKEDQVATRKVLDEFFDLLPNGTYTQRKAEEMIAEAQPKIEAARANGKKGGRPKKLKTETQNKPTGLLKETQAEPNGKASQSQSHINSVPNGTGADAPKSPADMTKDEIWAVGKSMLVQQNIPLKQCGSIVGKLCKDYGDDVVLAALRTAVVERPADALSYIKAVCMRHTGQRTNTKTTTTDRRIETLQGLSGGTNTTGENYGFIEAEARLVA